QVSGVDLTPELLAIAAAKAGGAEVTWLAADASATGLPDAGFDTVVSNMGIIFVEPVAMVAELARLVKSTGVLAFSTWVRAGDNPFFAPVVQVLGAPAAAAWSPDQWGEPNTVNTRLAGAFDDVRSEPGMFTWRFESLAASVRFITDESPMHVTTLSYLDDDSRARLIGAFTDAMAAHLGSDGTVVFDAPYAIITARRR
ncbi:MAG: methyltransferase domain-containing protein, partial [Mycobacterium sp.]